MSLGGNGGAGGQAISDVGSSTGGNGGTGGQRRRDYTQPDRRHRVQYGRGHVRHRAHGPVPNSFLNPNQTVPGRDIDHFGGDLRCRPGRLGGAGGDASGFASSHAGTGGAAGAAGDVNVSFASTNIYTYGYGAPGIATLSVGGAGGDGAQASSLFSSTGGSGAPGGNAGIVSFNIGQTGTIWQQIATTGRRVRWRDRHERRRRWWLWRRRFGRRHRVQRHPRRAWRERRQWRSGRGLQRLLDRAPGWQRTLLRQRRRYFDHRRLLARHRGGERGRWRRARRQRLQRGRRPCRWRSAGSAVRVAMAALFRRKITASPNRGRTFIGIDAMSVGGGGGDGGAAMALAGNLQFTASAAVGGMGHRRRGRRGVGIQSTWCAAPQRRRLDAVHRHHRPHHEARRRQPAVFSEFRIQAAYWPMRCRQAPGEALQDLDLSLAWPSISRFFAATGQFVRRGERVDDRSPPAISSPPCRATAPA